jgi:hypothetical protein
MSEQPEGVVSPSPIAPPGLWPRSVDPYAWIRNFWGEELSRPLLDRIVHAPEQHIAAFRDTPIPASALKNRPIGHARPVVTSVGFVPADRHMYTAPLQTALQLLLYTHEVVVDVPWDYLAYPRREYKREWGGEWLLALKPLYEAGIIHMVPVLSMKNSWRAESETEVLLKSLTEKIPELADPPPDQEGDSLKDLLFGSLPAPIRRIGLVQDVFAHIWHEKMWPEETNMLVRSPLELKLLEGLGRTKRMTEGDAQVSTLASLQLPNLATSTAEIAAIRGNSDGFALWRDSLGRALSHANPRGELREDMSADMLADVRESMLEATETITAETRKSSILGAMVKGLQEFGISGVAGVTAANLFGTPATVAVTAAGMAETLRSGREYRTRRQQAASDTAVRQLVLSVFPSQVP